jgi:uncharacterized membrane protein YqjE
VSDSTPGGTGHGLRAALARLGVALVGLVHTRLELAAIELGEERARIVGRLILVLVAVLAFASALFAASALVVVWFWDTHRIVAIGCVAIGYLLIGIVALWRLSLHRKADTPPFAATMAELERDRAWVAEKLGGDQ